MAIKNVLREELSNSIKLVNGYKRELNKLPEGSLILKKVKGNSYYYVVARKDGKVNFQYKGRIVPAGHIEKYKQAKELRKKYRNLLSKAKKQIKFLRGALRGRQEI